MAKRLGRWATRLYHEACGTCDGGAKRLGRAICLDLATQGYTYTVIVHYLHSHQEALQTQESCLDNGAPSAHVLGCDLSDQSARATLMPRAIALAGRV